MHVNTFQVGDLLGFQSFSCVCYLKKKIKIILMPKRHILGCHKFIFLSNFRNNKNAYMIFRMHVALNSQTDAIT